MEPVMRSYMEATDGTSIEFKESALVWHHQDADPDFGSCQAKEMLDHLESVLANEPVVVKRGQHIVEVKPQVIKNLSLSLAYPHKYFAKLVNYDHTWKVRRDIIKKTWPIGLLPIGFAYGSHTNLT